MQIAIYAYDGMTALDAVGPYDMLNRIPGANVVFVGDGAAPKTAQGGLELMALDLAEAPRTLDVILLPGGGRAVGVETRNQRLLEWIRTSQEAATFTTSVCTGALLLGAAGLLRDRRATTHWRARNALAGFGATYVDQRVAQDGHIITAAGVTAGLDMALLLADLLSGRHIAQAIQLSAQYEPEPPFPPIHYTDADPTLLTTVTESLGP